MRPAVSVTPEQHARVRIQAERLRLLGGVVRSSQRCSLVALRALPQRSCCVAAAPQTCGRIEDRLARQVDVAPISAGAKPTRRAFPDFRWSPDHGMVGSASSRRSKAACAARRRKDAGERQSGPPALRVARDGAVRRAHESLGSAKRPVRALESLECEVACCGTVSTRRSHASTALARFPCARGSRQIQRAARSAVDVDGVGETPGRGGDVAGALLRAADFIAKKPRIAGVRLAYGVDPRDSSRTGSLAHWCWFLVKLRRLTRA